jgi:response regulator RpfG family c-di-GMP phosphodiesterase
MTQLLPHLLLHSDIGTSSAAMILRNAGYAVTKIVDAEMALRLAQSQHVDGVIVERPVSRTIAFARQLLEATDGDIALLAISRAPETIQRLVTVPVLHTSAIEIDLVSTIDILIATRERCRSAFQNRTDALQPGA